MLWKKQIKGGIMLYALLMLSLFSLLLQFYLNRQLSTAQINQASKESVTAYAMAIWTRDKLTTQLLKTEEKKIAVPTAEPKLNLTNSEQLDAKDNSLFLNEINQDGEVLSEKQVADPKDQPKEKSEEKQPSQGTVSFVQGQTTYEIHGNELRVIAQLASGYDFEYVFHINSQKN